MLRIKPYKALIIGDLMLDTYYTGNVSRISPEAPVPVVKINNTYSVPGGAANVARNIVGLMGRPTVIGVAGRDSNASTLKTLLNSSGIEHIVISTEAPTTTKIRVIGNNQQVTRLDFETGIPSLAKVEAQLQDAIAHEIPKNDIVIISDYAKGVCTESLTRFIIESAHYYGKKVIIDPKGSDWNKYRHGDYITPNLKELAQVSNQQIANQDDAISAIATVIAEQFDIPNLIVTRSEKGISTITNSSIQTFPTQALNVSDVSGAGDTVVAALATGLCCDFTLPEAIEFANKAAAVVVSKVGTYAVNLNEIKLSNQNNCLYASEVEDLKPYICDKKVIFTNGCFDILHVGHIQYLEKAKQLGDTLIVGLNSDDSVKRLKGPARPVNTQANRAKALSALSCVDYVVIFDEDTPLNLIKVIQPDILVKGGDYRIDEVVGREYAKEVRLIDFVEGHSTTKIIESIKSTN